AMPQKPDREAGCPTRACTLPHGRVSKTPEKFAIFILQFSIFNVLPTNRSPALPLVASSTGGEFTATGPDIDQPSLRPLVCIAESGAERPHLPRRWAQSVAVRRRSG